MEQKQGLKRALTLFPTTAIVIGAVVGSGIFATPAGMSRELGNAGLLLVIWVAAGALTLFGALTQCELIGQMPKTGGLYQYFREIYGERIGFLYGWANFMIAGSGAIAAIAIIFAYYLGEFVSLPHLPTQWEQLPVSIPLLGDIFPFKDIGAKCAGASAIILLTLINIRGVKIGATLQTISTSAKVIAIVAILFIAFVIGSHIGSTSHWSEVTAAGASLDGWKLVGAIAAAVTGAFWSYDGWGNVAYIGGEVKDPTKTIPRAIIIGTLTFITIYVLMNLAYYFILPVQAVGTAPDDRVASLMVTNVIGGLGGAFVAALIMLSTFDTTNSSILTNARVYYAMAKDKRFIAKAASVHPRYQTPYIALLLQCAWSLVLIFSGSFDLLLGMYIFVNWLLYVFMAVGVFVMRKRHPNAERPFKVPGYPYVPLVFILFATAYVVFTLVTDYQKFTNHDIPFMQSVMGLVLVLAGLPFYYFWKYKERSNG